MRILHAADLHLDSAYTALSAEKAYLRRQESRSVLTALSDLCREEQIDLVLLAGDVFDGERVFPETISLLKDTLAQLNCPVCISPGNHDPYTPLSPYAREEWPENVHIFRSDSISAIFFPELRCTVHGAAFTAPHRYTRVLEYFSAPRDGNIHLLCLHGAANEPQSVYGPITREDLMQSGCAYAALGHVHQYSGVRQEDGCVWVYPGCTEGRGFDETGDKGAVITEITDGRIRVHFVPLCRRRYHILTADVTDTTPIHALEQILPDTAAEDICRVVFTGETKDGIDLRALERELSHRFFSFELRDETRVSRDLWHSAGEDSLRGIFLAELRKRYDAAESDDEKQRIIAAVRFGLAALDGRDTE